MIPKLLKEIPNPPEELFIRGTMPKDDVLSLAIVGTRKATDQGKNIAKNLAKEFSKLGIVIVSGLAMGIDTASHEGALEANGTTIAVLGTGIDKIYPAQNQNLANRILNNHGAIVSEYPSATPGYKDNFIKRNRIISGLSQAVIVVEAPLRSGAVSTASFAGEQGREVFVIPGPANHPNYLGSHKLIRDGCRLITSYKDVLEDLGWTDNLRLNLEVPNDIADEIELLIFNTLRQSTSPLIIDKILELTKLEPQRAFVAISKLVVRGYIKETDTGYTL